MNRIISLAIFAMMLFSCSQANQVNQVNQEEEIIDEKIKTVALCFGEDISSDSIMVKYRFGGLTFMYSELIDGYEIYTLDHPKYKGYFTLYEKAHGKLKVHRKGWVWGEILEERYQEALKSDIKRPTIPGNFIDLDECKGETK